MSSDRLEFENFEERGVISSLPLLPNTHFAQSAGAVEYTDCTSAEG